MLSTARIKPRHWSLVLMAVAVVAVTLVLLTTPASQAAPELMDAQSRTPRAAEPDTSLAPSTGAGPATRSARDLLEDVLTSRSLRTCADVMTSPPMSYPSPLDLYRRTPSVYFPDGSVRALGSVEALHVPPTARKLMLVAHADDELLFGGSDLLAGPPEAWLVVVANRVGPRDVVLTNVTRHFRLAALVTLEHFEKWELSYYDTRLVRDLDMLLRMRVWEVVVTHAVPGEYGHTQHRALHVVVAALVGQGDIQSTVREFRVFQFHKRGAPPETRSDEAVYVDIRKALEIYGEKIVKSFGAMVRSSGPSVYVNARTAMPLANITAVVCTPFIPGTAPVPVRTAT